MNGMYKFNGANDYLVVSGKEYQTNGNFALFYVSAGVGIFSNSIMLFNMAMWR